MSKQVYLEDGTLRMNETELQALQLVGARAAAAQSGRAQIGLSDMAESMGVCRGSARRAMRGLERRGLVERIACYHIDGGQSANAYVLTVSGARLLAS